MRPDARAGRRHRGRCGLMSGLRCDVLTTNSAALDAIDRLFGSAINETLFHHPRFLSYHGADKFPDAQWRHYLFSWNGSPVAFLPGAVTNGGDPTFHSPLGSSHGGLVHEALSYAKLDECLNLWWEDIKGLGCTRAEIVLAPAPYWEEAAYSEAIEFKLNQLGFVLRQPELCLIVPIEADPDFPRHLVRASAWRNAKQALTRGVTVRHSAQFTADLERFYPILADNRKRFGATPTHSCTELLRIHDLAPEGMHLFLATADADALAGILAFQATPSVLNAFYPADSPRGRDLRAMDLLLVELYRWALEHSIRWVDLGPSSFRLMLNMTLTRFKESHGGQTFLRRRYVWNRSNEDRR
ncbi:GNAT family N-acetyltransferase [Candidatus Solirubrobacter pratensis]|uniref:GNAT family N-acetyltransferase n=1 Tax=Candidatus Solirubrobacter pratensis TaxID=1298857 RepID=UPI0009DBFA3F|nr:GNAT family N-acetyltransferase [Candidatus Solirubrobacter pratensis]